MRSGMTVLLDNCVIRQEEGMFDNVFRGANIHLDPEDLSAQALSIEPLEKVKMDNIDTKRKNGKIYGTFRIKTGGRNDT